MDMAIDKGKVIAKMLGLDPDQVLEREVMLAELPYVSAGPYHTNTRDALLMARTLLGRKKQPNKQIFLITDGKPTVGETDPERIAEAADRLRLYGANTLEASEKRSDLSIFIDQFNSLPVGLLGVSAVISAMTGGTADAA